MSRFPGASGCLGGNRITDCSILALCLVMLFSVNSYSGSLPVELKVLSDKEALWSKKNDLKLEAAEQVVLRTKTNVEIRGELFFKSGKGQYIYGADFRTGEQILMIPKGCFERKGKAGWSKIEKVELSLPARKTPGSVELIELGTLAKGEDYFADKKSLYLLEPISRINRVGKAWPLYGILDGMEIGREKRGYAGRAFAGFLEKMYGVELPVNPEDLPVKTGIRNVILIGRKMVTVAGVMTSGELEEQGYDGFVVKANHGVVAVAGESKVGTNNGLTHFLMRQGCEFYGWYARPADVVPKKKQPTILTDNFHDRPFFKGIRHGYY